MGVVRQLVRRPLDPVRADRPGTWTPCRSSPRHSPHPRLRWKSETAPECSAAVRSDEHGRSCSGFIANTASRSSSRRSSHSKGHGSPTSRGNGAGLAGADQLYVLVAGREQEVGVIAARHGPASRLTDQQRESIRRAFLGPLQAGEADGALEQGVRAIGCNARLRRHVQAETQRPGCPDLGDNPRGGLGGPSRLPDSGMVRGQEQATSSDRRRSCRAGQVVGSPSASSMTPRVPRAAPASEMSEPLRTARVSARCRQQVEA